MAFAEGGGAERKGMNAKKLVVASATVVTLTLFAGAMYAQQPAVLREDTEQTSIARRGEGERPDARATRAGIGGGRDARFWRPEHRSAESSGPHRESRLTLPRGRYVNASALEESESSFGRRSREAHQAGSRIPEHARSHR